MQTIDPRQTPRAAAFELWRKAPMPMVTLFKTLDVTNLRRCSRKHALQFHMLMCWCIGKAACQTDEFYLLPVGDAMMQYDKLAVNTVVETADGTIHTCDIPYSDDLTQFQADYRRLTRQVRESCENHDLEEGYMVIGTSALVQYDIDGAVNLYAGIYNNPFLIWGRYRKRLHKTILPISFQFHHTQMDGVPAARFLDRLQREIATLRI